MDAFLGMELAGLALEQRALVWAGAGLLVVLVAAAAARSEVRLHFIAVGQLATAGALGSVVSSAGGVRLACIGAWTLGWVVEIAAGEVRGRSENAFGRAFAVLGPLLVVLSLPVLVLEAARFAGLLEGRPGLPGVLLAVLALLEAFIARAIERRRPLAELVVAGAFGTSLVAIGASGEQPWPAIAACAGLIVVVIVIPASLRILDGLGGLAGVGGSLCSLRSGRACRTTGSSRLGSSGRPWCSSAGSRWTTGSQVAASAATWCALGGSYRLRCLAAPACWRRSASRWSSRALSTGGG